jgi:hypothetical protein
MNGAVLNYGFGALAGLLVLSASAQEASFQRNDRSASMRCGQACDGFLLAWERATTVGVPPSTERGSNRPIPSEPIPPIQIEVKATAAEQLQLGRQLLATLDTHPYTSDLEQHVEMLRVIGHLEIIATLWPKETDAIAESAILSGDVFVNRRSPQNAVDIVTRALAVAGDSAAGPSLQRVLGTAYARMGRKAEAERAFLAGERHPQFHRIDRSQRVALLLAAADFFERSKRPVDAAVRQKAVSKLFDDQALHETEHFLKSVELNAAGNRGAARADLAQLDQLVRKVQQATYRDPADLANRNEIEERFKAVQGGASGASGVDCRRH